MNWRPNLERRVDRVVVGNNTPTTHPTLGTIPVKGCFPQPLTLTGTLVTDNAGTTAGLLVLGTGTFFITGNAAGTGKPVVEVGDFIADANFVLRRVESIQSDTMLTLEYKFPANLAAAVFYLVKKNFYRFIRAKSTGTANPTLQEQTFKQLDIFDNDGTPVSYDVTTASSEISFTLSQ